MATRTFIVWNEAKTEGFATTDYQLAYEARKGALSNCYHEDGTLSHLAVEFCGLTENENCSIEEVEESLILEDGPREGCTCGAYPHSVSCAMVAPTAEETKKAEKFFAGDSNAK